MEITSLFFNLKSTTIEIPYKEEYSQYQKNDYVIFKTDDFAEEIAQIKTLIQTVNKTEKIDLSGEILRKASPLDLQKFQHNHKEAKKIREFFLESTQKMDLEMQLVSANYSLDNALIYITFIAENRVDFRELVKLLAKKFQKKIHLQQIGPRDRSALFGGYGLCGQEFCCKRFLGEIPSVTMEAVRVQNIAYKGAEKLSGQCGKLMCCLNYEKDQYKQLSEKFPKFGSTVKHKGQKGTVIGLDVLNEKVKIKFDTHNVETVLLSELDK